MLSPHEQLIAARQILSGEMFAPTESHLAIEKTLECLGSLAPFRFVSVTMKRRFANEQGRLLLNDLQWLLDGDAYTRSRSRALSDLVEALGRAVHVAASGVRGNPPTSQPSRVPSGN